MAGLSNRQNPQLDPPQHGLEGGNGAKCPFQGRSYGARKGYLTLLPPGSRACCRMQTPVAEARRRASLCPNPGRLFQFSVSVHLLFVVRRLSLALRGSISFRYHAVVFRRFRFSFALVTLVAINALQCCPAAAATTTFTALKSYPLHGWFSSADISPDEKLVAVVRTSEVKTGGAELSRSSAVVELWDFHSDRLVARTTLEGPVARPPGGGTALYRNRGAPFVRFTGDGMLVVVYFADAVRMLRTSDLSETGSMPLNPPPSNTLTYSLKKYGVQKTTYVPAIQGFETSPTGTLLAVLWVGPAVRGNSDQGRLEIYDISSGQRIDMWRMPNSWAPDGVGRDLAWGPASKYIFMARPNSIPCLRPNGSPDVFGLNLQTGALETTLNTGLMVGDIAVTPAGELLAVDANCVGRWSNRHPKMVVFNLKTGNRVREVRAKGTGVRYRVSVSRNGQRAVAWTSDVKCSVFDWLDMNCYGQSVKPMFTVWRLPEFSVVATSPVLPGEALASQIQPTGPVLRISSTGCYVLVYGMKGVVFEVP